MSQPPMDKPPSNKGSKAGEELPAHVGPKFPPQPSMTGISAAAPATSVVPRSSNAQEVAPPSLPTQQRPDQASGVPVQKEPVPPHPAAPHTGLGAPHHPSGGVVSAGNGAGPTAGLFRAGSGVGPQLGLERSNSGGPPPGASAVPPAPRPPQPGPPPPRLPAGPSPPPGAVPQRPDGAPFGQSSFGTKMQQPPQQHQIPSPPTGAPPQPPQPPGPSHPNPTGQVAPSYTPGVRQSSNGAPDPPAPPAPRLQQRQQPPPLPSSQQPQQHQPEERRMPPGQHAPPASHPPPPHPAPHNRSMASRPTQPEPPQQMPNQRFHAKRPVIPPPQQQQPQPPPAANPRPAPAGGGGMRELRVEDALLYLDDVKREFGDRPRIYNEFLEIMKNFKSQEVDTPGVIERVSRLFRGYNNLILGFNKFLPDGYKITTEDIRKSNEEHRRAQEAAAAAAAASRQQPQHFPPTGPQQPHAAAGQAPPPRGPYHQQGGHMQPHGGQMKGSPPTGPGGARPAGHSPPQGFRRSPVQPNQQPQMGTPGAMQPGTPPQNLGQQQQHHAPNQPQQGGLGQTPGAMQAAGRGAPPGGQQHQAVEFDHAISYVTNIKRRFANDLSTYHKFLEILHTYQKEQRGIKEVLEQVAALFEDHPDLLKEFTFFLPDAVQEQAKERLHRAAADSEARQAAARERAQFGQDFRGSRVEQQRQHLPYQKIHDMTGVHAADQDVSPSRQGITASRKRPFSPPSGGAMMPLQPPHPETFVYNSAVERQFFDSVKDALTSYPRDGGQAWQEFLKCLDLYAQEILSRNEMLTFVEPLLGKHLELFERFKRILAAAGAQSGLGPSIEDAWYSVPLSEIDFSRCRRCSPSYRALPRDYPAPPTSDRSEEESKVLNDVWVSLPVGSEESYTFRHMRRNTYEETLFRCEDERFEVDMVIDSNAATLRRLEPIEEEIIQLSQEEMITPDLSTAAVGSKPGAEGVGMGGKKYQYTFDSRRILGVIHRNAIARIYGDSGQEMLDLMVKNPTVAIPLVVQRLRQKDREWKAARERLNRHWKELAEVNYYKSLDNRALTWRTIDKRATSTRTLVAEIKDRAANNGKESEAALTARLDKAKEEHGSFYEKTMRENLTTDLDLTNLPKPDAGLFTPHLSLIYESSSWAQRDAYRIIAFAVERGSTSPADKERCHRLWREFLGPWFGLSLNWMQRPAIDYSSGSQEKEESPIVVSNSAEENVQDDEMEDEEMSSADEDDLGKNVVTEELKQRDDNKDGDGSDLATIMGNHVLPPGARVLTLYGEGRIVHFRRDDNTYLVALPFGATAYLQPSGVLCSVLSAEKSGFTNQLRNEDSQTLERPDDLLIIGTQSLYLFFRLHQILIRRLGIAKEMAYKVCTDKTLSTLVEQMKGDPGQDMGRKRYDACISLIYALIAGGHNAMGSSSGAAEGGRYEDRVRCLLGHGAYELATMDKLISHIVKNLQNMASDETMHNLVQLFRRHLDAGSFKPDAFRQEAAYLSEGENLFAFQHCKVPDSDETILHAEFLGVITESDEESEDQREGAPQSTDVLMTDAVSETSGGHPQAKKQRRA